MFSKIVVLSLVLSLGSGGAALAENLPGSEWQPTELMAKSFEPAGEIFLRFEQDGRYFGNGGCNTFRGAFVTNGTAILLGPAAATMMACPGEISQQESDFLQTLMTVREYQREGTALTLINASGETVLKLSQRDAD